MSAHPESHPAPDVLAPASAGSALDKFDSGLLGIVGSFGKMIKEVGAAPHAGEAAHPAPAAAHAHPAAHPAPAAAHPGETAAPAAPGHPAPSAHGHEEATPKKEGAKGWLPGQMGEIADVRRLGKEVTNAFTAWRKGTLDEETLERPIDAALDMLNWEPLRLFSLPLAFGLKKLLGASHTIHEIAPQYKELGEQILSFHKDKDGTFHHSVEGLSKGIADIAQLNRQFRFLSAPDDTRLTHALGSSTDDDRTEMKAQIASLLGVKGTLDEAEAKEHVTHVLKRLGVENTGTPGHPHFHRHGVHTSVDAKHEALVKIYQNAYTWLTEPRLKQLYHNEKEKELTIDYDTFGNYAFENVKTDKDITAFEKAYKPRVFENKFRFLLDATRFDAALKKDDAREEVKKQVYSLFDLSGGVDAADITRQADELKKTLKLNTTPAAVAGTFKGDLLANIDKAVGILIRPDKLKVLFEGAEKELTIDYDTFGNYVFENVKDTQKIPAFFKAYKPRVFENKFRILLDKDRLEKALSTDTEKEEAKKQVYALFDLSNGVDEKDIDRQAGELKKSLGLDLLPPPLPDSMQEHLLTQVNYAVTNLKRTGVLKALFEGADKELTIDYDTFGNYVFENVKTDKDIAAFEKAYKPRVFENKFRILLDKDRLEKALSTDTGKEEAKKQVYALFDLSGAVDKNDLDRQVKELKKTLTPKGVAGATTPPLLPAMVLHYISIAEGVLTGTNLLEKLFEGVAKSTAIDYENFGDLVLEGVSDKAAAEAFYRGFKPDIFQTKFELLVNKKELERGMKKKETRDEIKGKIRELLNMSGSMGLDALVKRRDKLVSLLAAAALPTATGVKNKHEEFGDLTKTMLENLGWDFSTTAAKTGPDNLWATLYAEKPETMTPRYAEFGQYMDGLNAEDLPAALRGYSRAAFRKQFRPLWDKASLDKEVKKEDTRKVAATHLLALIGYPAGSGLSFSEMEKVIKSYQAFVDPQRSSTDTDVKKGADEMWEDLGEILTSISSDAELNAVMAEKKETIYENFYSNMTRDIKGTIQRFSEMEFRGNFKAIINPLPASFSTEDKKAAREEVEHLFGKNVMTQNEAERTIDTMVKGVIKQKTDPTIARNTSLMDAIDELVVCLNEIKSNLTDENLRAINAP